MKNKKYNLFIIIKMMETTDINNIINPEIDLSKITDSIWGRSHPNTKLFIEENKHLINKYILNNNTADGAIEYLINNPDKINWEKFSENKNDKAVEYLIKNPDKIDWYYFLQNENTKIDDYIFNWKEKQESVLKYDIKESTRKILELLKNEK